MPSPNTSYEKAMHAPIEKLGGGNVYLHLRDSEDGPYLAINEHDVAADRIARKHQLGWLEWLAVGVVALFLIYAVASGSGWI